MVIVGAVIEFVLWSYFVLLLARIACEWLQMFARSWQPVGPALVSLEFVYTATDPPIKLFRRFVPPLRLGNAALDLSILFVLLICYLLRSINRSILLAG
ncbi:MAG: YggT family protein [Nocardioidaceae bacterium]